MAAQRAIMGGRSGWRALPAVLSVWPLAAALAALAAPARPAIADVPATAPAASRPDQVKRLIALLGDNDYRTRERAESDLIAVGEPALADVNAALQSQDVEVQVRAERVVAAIRLNLANRAILGILARQQWKYKVSGGILAGPVACKGLVCLADGDGVVHALDAKTGKELWASGANTCHAGLAAGEGMIFVGGDDAVCALAADGGKVKWKKKLDAPCSQLACDGSSVYVVTGDASGAIACLSADSGDQVWVNKTEKPIAGPPAVSGELVYYATSQSLYACDLKWGKTKWTAALNRVVLASPTVQDGVVYVGTAELQQLGTERLYMPTGATHLLAYDAANGTQKWTCKMTVDPDAKDGKRANFPLVEDMLPRPLPVAMSDGLVFMACRTGLGAVDVKSGQVKWSFQPKFTPANPGNPYVQGPGGRPVMVGDYFGAVGGVLADRGVVLVGSRNGMHALNPRTGEETWLFPTWEEALRRPVVLDGLLYLVSCPSAMPAGDPWAMAKDPPRNVVPEKDRAGGLHAVDISGLLGPASRPAKGLSQ